MNKHIKNSTSEIGVFDSGLGGISVLKDISHFLPNEDIFYYGDSRYAPYGEKKISEVIKLSDNIIENMQKRGCKAVVIACNTATSAAANYLRQKYQMPIIGMEPALKPAIIDYPKGDILVLATEMTLNNKKFRQLLDKYKSYANVVKGPAPELVYLVENKMASQQTVNEVLDRLLINKTKNYHAVVLGCTHFIFLKKYIQAYFGQETKIYDGNIGTAKHLKEILSNRKLLNTKAESGKVIIENSAGAEKVATSYELMEHNDD